MPRYEPDIGVTRLETMRVSRAAADQRRGRAGRTAPGICYRLWDAAATGALEPFAPPEILDADLAPLLLDCAAWGLGDPAALAWLDPPPRAALAEARALLVDIEAIDADGRLTADGVRLSGLGLPPRLSRMLVTAAGRGQGRLAADIAAVITERGLGGDSTDLVERLERFRADRSPRAGEMRRLAEAWLAAAGGVAVSTQAGDPSEAGPVLALAFPDRVAVARGRPGAFTMENGRGAAVEPQDRLAREPTLVIAEIAGAAGAARILLAAPISAAEIEALSGIVATTETSFDMAAVRLRARSARRYRRLVLAETPAPLTLDEAAAGDARRRHRAARHRPPALDARTAPVAGRGAGFLRAASAGLRTRLAGPVRCGARGSAQAWLAPGFRPAGGLGPSRRTISTGRSPGSCCISARRRLEAEAPTHFPAPTGSERRHRLRGRGRPGIAVRVQELFGLAQHPPSRAAAWR